MIKEPLEELDQLVMVSGGVGVTPMIALLEDMVSKKFTGKLDFIWSTRSVAEIEAFRPHFEKAASFPNMNIQVFYTGGKTTDTENPSSENKGFTVTNGRPSLSDEIKVNDLTTSAAILCCGPDPLMVAVEGIAVDLQKAGKTILFHRETFEF